VAIPVYTFTSRIDPLDWIWGGGGGGRKIRLGRNEEVSQGKAFSANPRSSDFDCTGKPLVVLEMGTKYKSRF
jgi:hypothetical protein